MKATDPALPLKRCAYIARAKFVIAYAILFFGTRTTAVNLNEVSTSRNLAEVQHTLASRRNRRARLSNAPKRQREVVIGQPRKRIRAGTEIGINF